MPIQQSIWKVGDKPTPLSPSRLANEQMLEGMIEQDPSILSGEWMLIGRQVETSYGGRIDLLAIAPDGSLVLIELKRDRTPRDVIAQALDYASWVDLLTPETIAGIYQRFSNGGDLGEEFKQRFGAELEEEALNQSHQITIVAAELDAATERIIEYLNTRDIAINAVFFQVFQHHNDQFLSRTWLIDPSETQANVASITKAKDKREPWNGEYYVSFGPMKWRDWEDARQYSFISAGGGSWYSRTLNSLSPGDRVWVNIPRTGYVGVGLVTQAVRHVANFIVQTESGERPALEVLKLAEDYKSTADDPEKAEYFVGMEWLNTVAESEAVNEVGLFGNQNTVCQPTTPKWRHTVERLKTYFPNWNKASGSFQQPES